MKAKSIFSIIFGAFLLLAGVPWSSASAAAIRIMVPSQARVSGETILLGDIAVIEGADLKMNEKLAAVSLGASPKPGKTRAFDADLIRMQLGREGFASNEVMLETPDRLEVIREARQVDVGEIRDRVAAYFTEHRLLDEMKVELVDLKMINSVVLPVGPYTLTIETPYGNRRTGIIPINLLFESEGGYQLKARATAKVKLLTDAVVVRRPIDSGHVIEAADIETARVDLSTLPNNAVMNPKTVIGKAIKHPVPPRTILRTDLMDEPPMVVKGDIVTICAESGELRVTTLGEVKENGRSGEQIRVTNLESKKDLFVRVVDSRTVKVVF
jgi:flagellar basal body P-ring formation protein FlgA